MQYTQAHDNALRQFLARNVHITTQRTGVLLFVSLAERYAAVVADAGIDRQVRQEDWDGVVAELVEQARRGSPRRRFRDGHRLSRRPADGAFPRRPG